MDVFGMYAHTLPKAMRLILVPLYEVNREDSEYGLWARCEGVEADRPPRPRARAPGVAPASLRRDRTRANATSTVLALRRCASGVFAAFPSCPTAFLPQTRS
jgi:hypothetical protein